MERRPVGEPLCLLHLGRAKITPPPPRLWLPLGAGRGGLLAHGPLGSVAHVGFFLTRQLAHRRQEQWGTVRALWHWALALQGKVSTGCTRGFGGLPASALGAGPEPHPHAGAGHAGLTHAAT